MISNVSARRWVGSFTDHPQSMFALAGLFQCVSKQTYECSVDSQGSPLTDMSLGAKPYGKPRLPFMISPIVEVGATDDVAMSFCISTPSAAPMIRRTGPRRGRAQRHSRRYMFQTRDMTENWALNPVLCHMTGAF